MPILADGLALPQAPAGLGVEAIVTLGAIAAMTVALVRDWAQPDLIVAGSLGLLLLAGVVTPEQAFAGFANPAVLTIGSLFVVAAGIQRTGALSFMDDLLVPASRSIRSTLFGLMTSTAGLSAFLNNTPIVAMLTPRVLEREAATGVPGSKLLIPLSYAAILGGMCTLIGTSTNVIVAGILADEGLAALSMFDLAWVGIPAAVLVIAYFMLVGHRLLPDRRGSNHDPADGLEECLFELRVAQSSPAIGSTVEEAGLRALGDAYLRHVRRGASVIPSSPHVTLRGGDVLAFTGRLDAMERLLERPGLERAVPHLPHVEPEGMARFEAVVADSSQLVGKTLRDVGFRENYHGIVLGVQRSSEQMEGPLGRTPIRAGDLLVVESWNGFDERWNSDRREFYLVARRGERKRPRRGHAPIALGILGLMILAFATGVAALSTAAFAAALAMVVTRCLHGREARAAIDFSVLIVIAAALGIGEAVQETGLAATAAGMISTLVTGAPPIAAVAAIFITTNLLTELITNNAAAVLMLPVGLATAATLGLPPHAFAVTVAIAASASFITPIGYQTNLMVMAPGGYRFTDYVRAGLPVMLIVLAVTTITVSTVWL